MPNSFVYVWLSNLAVDAQQLTDYTFGSVKVFLSDFDLNQGEQ